MIVDPHIYGPGWTPTYHPRSVWEDPARPVTGPAWVPRLVDMIVPHYTAAIDLIDGDLGEFIDDLPAYLRAIQRDYVVTRGYSVGYWWAIDWLGGIWQLRGFDPYTGLGGFKSAANAGHNDHTGPILFLVDGDDEPTGEAMRAARWLNACTRRHPYRGRRTQLAVVDHGRLPIPPGNPTACAGKGIRRVVDKGFLSDEFQTFPTQPQETTDMPTTLHLIPPADAGVPELIVCVDGAGVQLIGLNGSTSQTLALIAAMKATTVSVSAEQYGEFVARAAQ
jgi:hypothetical protein